MTLSIRRWLALALLALFIVPVLSMIVIGFFLFARNEGPDDIDRIIEDRITQDAAHWTDPAWQDDLLDYDADVVLVIGGDEVFRTGDPLDTDENRLIRRVTIPETDPVQSAYIISDNEYGPPDELRQWFVPVIQGVVILLTLAGIAWFLRRSIVDPLTAASEAAQRIAQGEMDITLPASRVREVDQLGRSFEAMSADLQQSLSQQAALERDRRRFISAIAHDLRTPLFSLRGSLEGLEQGVAKTPEQQRRYLGIAQAKADQLERLIADLFSFTRLEYLEERPDRESVDIAGLCRDVTGSAQTRAHGQRFEVVAPETPVVIQADRHLLVRALDNLLDNALRYTPETGSIQVTVREQGETVTIQVADSGSGFAEGDLPHLFEPLFRGEASRSRETGGAGLGLTIAQRIVAAHGGTLEASNAPEGGAQLVVTLPTGG